MSNRLCEELILEIFARLPVKSLLRFRSISKSLGYCISTRDFIRAHTLCSPKKFLIRHVFELEKHKKQIYTLHSEDRLPLQFSGGYSDDTTFKFPYHKSEKIVGSCNGMICIHERENYIISLWNSSVRRKLTLPPIPFLDYKTEERSLLRHVCYIVRVGIGFYKISDDYKILWMLCNIYDCMLECAYVYALKQNAWSEIALPNRTSYKMLSVPVLTNGSLHWLVDRFLDETRVNLFLGETRDVDRRDIMTFDLSTHIFGTIALPKPDWTAKQLIVIKGSLAVISKQCDSSWIYWMRVKDNNKSDDAYWHVVYRTETDHFAIVSKIYEMAADGCFLVHTYGTNQEVYNFETGVQSRLVDFVSSSSYKANVSRVDVEKFVETLELLDRGTTYKAKQPSFLKGNKRVKRL